MTQTSDRERVEYEVFKAQLRTRQFYTVGGLILLALGATGIAVFSFVFGRGTEVSGFVGLLIIAMAALATTAAVFAGLRMSSRGEAFGLPSGSIRALLALGIMMLFVVFGLPITSSRDGAISDRPFRTVSVAPASITAEIQRYRDQGLIVVLSSPGGPGPATLELYATSTVSPAVADLNKQMLTAIITLLTAVVSFYFGSRSATDSTRGDSGSAESSSRAELAVQRKAISDEMDKILADEPSWRREIDRVRALAPPENKEEAVERANRLAAVDGVLKTFGEARAKTQAALERAEGALKPLIEDVDLKVRRVQEEAAQNALNTAKAALGELRGAADAAKTAVAKLTETAAEG